MGAGVQFATNKFTSAFKEYVRPVAGSISLDLSNSSEMDPKQGSSSGNANYERGHSGDVGPNVGAHRDVKHDYRDSSSALNAGAYQHSDQQGQSVLAQQQPPMLQQAQLQLQYQLSQQQQAAAVAAAAGQGQNGGQGQAIGLNPMMPTLNMMSFVSASQQFADMNGMEAEGEGEEDADESESDEDANPDEALEVFVTSATEKGCQVRAQLGKALCSLYF